MNPDAISVRILLFLLSISAGPVSAGFWKGLDAFFSASPLEPAHELVLAEAGWAYLKRKDGVFEATRTPSEPNPAAIPVTTDLADGGWRSSGRGLGVSRTLR